MSRVNVEEKWPVLGRHERAAEWLGIWTNLGRARRTIDAYSRGLAEYLLVCERDGVDPLSANRSQVALFVRELATRPHRGANVVALDSGVGLSNATLQQRLVPVRLFYDFLIEEGVRDSNPVGRGRYTPGRQFGGGARPLVPRMVKLPWIPAESEWARLLDAFGREPIRNRLMLALAYDSALRREELCSLRTDDFDPAHRTLRVRAETTKTRRERIVPYSASTGVLLGSYLRHRGTLSRARGPLFLSESRRNLAEPLTLWTWSKVVRRVALAADVPRFSTHTTRHLCLTDLARMGWELHVIATFAGHYAGDRVKWVVSGCRLVEPVEQPIEDLLPAELSLVGCVVALALQGRPELDGGLEEGARFADRFEVAVQSDGSGAVPVAEHAAVHFRTQSSHLGAFRVGRQGFRCVVEGFDLLADGEVFVGDGAVGDPRINHRHPHGAVPKQGSDGLEGHAPVDRLSGQCVSELMWSDPADPGGPSGLRDGAVDPVLTDSVSVFDEQVSAAQGVRAGGEPAVQQVFQLRVQRDVAVVAELPDRHVQPVGGPDLHHRIGGEVEEFALAKPGSGEKFHGESNERVIVGSGGLEQFGERGVVEEAWQRLIPDGQVAGENQYPRGGVVSVPFGEPLEAGAHRAQVFGEADRGQSAAAGRSPAGELQFVGLDMGSAQVGDPADLGGVLGQPAGEFPQHALDADHRGRPQRQPGLGDVVEQGRGEHGRDFGPGSGPRLRLVGGLPAGRRVEHPGVEQHRVGAEQRTGQVRRAWSDGPVFTDRCEERGAAGIQHLRGDLVRGKSNQHRHLDQSGPLQPTDPWGEAELGGGGGEPLMEHLVVARSDLAQVGLAEHQVVRAGSEPTGDHQPAGHPAVLQRRRALLGRRQLVPAVHAYPGQERAGRGRHRVRGEHPGRDQVGPVGGDQVLDPLVRAPW